MIIASLMYANGLKKILEAMLFASFQYSEIKQDLEREFPPLWQAHEALQRLDFGACKDAKVAVRNELVRNRKEREQNDLRYKDAVAILAEAKVQATSEWFEKIKADHNGRINEGNFNRIWREWRMA